MNLLFDLDGTLTNPFPGITNCIIYALKKVGIEPPARKDLTWCIGPPLLGSLEKLLGSDDKDLAETALAHYRERFGSKGLFENQVYEGIPEALRVLRKAGNSLFVATSKPAVYARKIIDHFGLDIYFEQVYGSELDGTRTNKIHLLAHIMAKESMAAADTLMIGDRRHDIIGARENGISGIGVLWGFGTRAELEESGAKRIIEKPADLKGLF
ncbi:HAD family hydrolase [Dethiosulfatarculus sandiegensis]|nr:HAD family hydrolase [Dethiosulfatarculus sandiegensis]